MKVSELTGDYLDYWVARAECLEVGLTMDGCQVLYMERKCFEMYRPSADWAQCGPLIEKCQMYVEWDEDGYWVANCSGSATTEGSTAQEAICRAVVRAKFGDEVPEVAP